MSKEWEHLVAVGKELGLERKELQVFVKEEKAEEARKEKEKREAEKEIREEETRKEKERREEEARKEKERREEEARKEKERREEEARKEKEKREAEKEKEKREAEKEKEKREAEKEIREEEARKEKERREEEARKEKEKREAEKEIREEEARKEKEIREEETRREKQNQEHALKLKELEEEARRQKQNQEHELKLKELELAIEQEKSRREAARIDNERVMEGTVTLRPAVAPKLPSFDENNDDLDAYLHRFEQYATVNNWPRDNWATNLSALLRGVALQTYYQLPVDRAGDYECLKGALLKRFHLTCEGFREKFRQSRPTDDETFGQYITRLEGYLDRWIELDGKGQTFENLRDLLLREQALNVSHQDVKMFVLERKPTNIREMCQVAEQYLEVHGCLFNRWSTRSTMLRETATNRPPPMRSLPRPPEPKKCYNCGKLGHIAKDCRAKPLVSQKPTVAACGTMEEDEVTEGWVTLDDGTAAPYYKRGEDVIVKTDTEKYKVCMVAKLVSCEGLPIKKGWIGDQQVDVLRDTGCTGVIVRASLCKTEDFTRMVKACMMLNGMVTTAPVVKIEVKTPFYSGKLEALAMESPIVDLIIGNISGAKAPSETEHKKDLECEVITGAAAMMSKRFKPLKITDIEGLNLTPEQLKQMQMEDSILVKIRLLAENDNQRHVNERFYTENGVLYREYTASKRNGGEKNEAAHFTKAAARLSYADCT